MVLCCSAPFGALMRRNRLYRQRNWIATILEVVLPVGFCAAILGLKGLVDDGNDGEAVLIAAQLRTQRDVMIPMSFSDYVAALLAKRVCIQTNIPVDGGEAGGEDAEYDISGLPSDGYNWQVPFLKCDERKCQSDGEDAYDYCEYNMLAVAPKTAGDEAGNQRAQEFKAYVEERYPQLLDPTQTHFDGDGFEFVQLFTSNDAIDKYVESSDYGNGDNAKIGLAVVFDGNDPMNFKYGIRQNATNYNTWDSESQPASTSTPDTKKLFSTYSTSDTECSDLFVTEGWYSSSCTARYIYNGFLTTQRLVQDFMMVDTGAKAAGYFVSEHGVRYVPFPVRPYTDSGAFADLSTVMPLLLTLGILYPCATMISYLVQEKELRQKELLKMMGVTDLEIGFSWFFTFWMLHIITATFVTIISQQIFEKSSFGLLFLFWQFCFLGFIVLCMLLGTSASKTTRGVLIGILVVFGGFFLTLAADFQTGSTGIISLLSLHPVTAMVYGVSEIGRLEDEGIGLTPNSMTTTDSPSGFTFAGAITNLIVSCIFMGVLTWYFNRVIAPDYGQALPFYFPFTKSYWFPHSVQHAELRSSDADDDGVDDGVPVEPVTDNLKQQAKDGQSIEIINLRKDFGEKIAVDGLNLSMYSGQITALLGHNGAGKTTTISMLTGALSPTEGTATIAGKDIRTEMTNIREDIGICLQHDCLFPRLTVREHVQFFSRVKGIYGKMSYQEAEAGIDQAIRDVALEEKSNTFSTNLSGGMKRKLSVAIAFCGGSKVVFLDEPTSGMDPFSRRFSWNVIRQYRQDRCIILTTHFMDEADILGDRIAIMAEGRLRCCGSSLFLKKTYGVGYQLTIEKRSNAPSEKSSEEDKAEAASEEQLKEIVVGNVSDAVLLSNVGTELSFQLPLGSSNNFVPMLEQLDAEAQKGSISTYGVSITTLDEVFQIVARGDEKNKHDYRSSKFSSKDLAAGASGDDDEKSVRSRMDLENEGLFGTHVGALIRKRAANFKRDRKAWCCTTILPSIFVLIGLLLLKFVSPSRNLEPLELTLDDYNSAVGVDIRNPIPYNNPNSTFTCSPGYCTFEMSAVDLSTTDENYYFCGGPALANRSQSCTISDSESVVTEIDDYGATAEGGDAETILRSSEFILEQSSVYTASQYGGIFLTHDQDSTTDSGVSYATSTAESCLNNTGDYLAESECDLYGAGIGYTIAYNFTAIHASPLFQALADEGIVREAISSTTFQVSATIAPMRITKKETEYAEAIDAFNLWFLIVLSFPFIMGTFATFIVTERESKAKHLQTVAGVKPSAYWLSTLLWDFMNYCIPAVITIILVFAFGVDSLTTTDNDVLAAFLVLIFLFGPASAAFSYCVTFCFKSASLCNIVLIISGFLLSMGGSITTFFLRLIAAQPGSSDSLEKSAIIIEWIFRFFPPFCLGKGLLFIMNMQAWVEINQGPISAFDTDIAGIEIIFLVAESVVYLVAAIYIDVLSSNPEVMAMVQKICCCISSSARSAVAAIPDDDDVVAEQQRVLNGGANDDAIVMSELTKIYPNGKIAVNQLSLGIPPGECFGLLGINGAGKTTTMGMLTAEFPPTQGDATLAGFSLRHEPEKTRRRIGYCPQFDAHFQNMTGREHVELYASIKGVPSNSVRVAAADKLAQVGLSEKDSDRLSSNYSGGMKRRLSLACATIGQPQLVFLDECSTGVDPVARREIWQLVSDLVSAEVSGGQKTSVILTTHSMDECEALCPRIGIMANGKLRCLGSAQHLKTKFGKGYQLELKVDATVKEDEDYENHLLALAKSKGVELTSTRSIGGNGGDGGGGDDPEEQAATSSGNVMDSSAAAPDSDVFLNLPEAQHALQQITGDEYLSCMLNEQNPTGYGVYKDAFSPTGVLLSDLSTFVTNELRMRDLNTFIVETYPTAILRERQDMKARFEVSSEDISIAQIFASIEENKEKLKLSDYGVSQTSLEQVFNMHAAEAERLKQGRMDG